jgi:cysteine desulfurase
MSSTPRAYFDHNASAPLRPCARAIMVEAMDITSNPSSIHADGRVGRKYIETARRVIGETFDVSPNQIIFTSGATEANNTILKGFAGKRILVGATEHLSVLESGVPVTSIPVDENGIIKLDELENLLRDNVTALVSVMYVNNETGVIQPISDIAALAHKYGALFHVDAVQAYGRIPFTREVINADFITISSHKIGGPLGAGAIIFKPQTTVPVLLHGGGHERRQRAGTENFMAIAGFGAASIDAVNQIPEFQKLSVWRDAIEIKLVADGCMIFGNIAARVSNTICFAHPTKDSQTMLMAFDMNGISLSSGSACSSGTIKPSHVLQAMNIAPDLINRALRLSFGWNTTQNDIDLFLKIWDKVRV